MPWRNHAHGSKHHHFRYPSTWRCRVNPGRFGGACGRRSGLQCRGRDRPLAQHSPLWLTQSSVRGPAVADSANSRQDRPGNCCQSGRPAAKPPDGAARTDRGHKPSQSSNSRWISSPSPLWSCSTPVVAVLRSRDRHPSVPAGPRVPTPAHHPACGARGGGSPSIVLQVHDWDSHVVSVGGEGSITGHRSALGAQEPPQG
jgi:hypothetical protein